ncbi:MAG TPA: hypothetical protein VFS43_34355 [Polyangiaceae bacterium]|nr:hypothetical protein [Polyangiaceae bacterium]
MGLRRARALDVPVGLQQPVGVDLRVTVEGLPAYMTAEPLTIPAGASAGVLIMRATEGAPLGVPSQVRVRAAGAGQPAEAVLEAWVQGEPGTLDETFGEGGIVVGPAMASLAGIAPLPDGSLVAVGNSDNKRVMLVHHLADGQPDPAFGDQNNSGPVVFYAPPSASPNVYADEEEARAAAVQPDGKVVIFGIRTQLERASSSGEIQIKGYQWHVSRHLAQGTLDAAFGEGGAASFSDGVAAPVGAKAAEFDTPLGGIAVAGDGTLVIAARDSYDPASPYRLLRLTPGGKADETFGQAGFVRGPQIACRPTSVVVSPGGDVVVGGNKADGQGREQACVARFLPTGAPDLAFGDQGSRALPVLQREGVLYERALGVAVDDEGAVLGGFTRGQNSSDTILLAKLLGDGAYDASFGQGGRATQIPSFLATDSALRVTAVVRSAWSGDLIAAQQVVTDGSFGGVSPLALNVAKYDAKGGLVQAFGTGGATEIPINAGQAYLFRNVRLAEDAGGRILIAGVQDGTQRIARLWP